MKNSKENYDLLVKENDLLKRELAVLKQENMSESERALVNNIKTKRELLSCKDIDLLSKEQTLELVDKVLELDVPIKKKSEFFFELNKQIPEEYFISVVKKIKHEHALASDFLSLGLNRHASQKENKRSEFLGFISFFITILSLFTYSTIDVTETFNIFLPNIYLIPFAALSFFGFVRKDKKQIEVNKKYIAENFPNNNFIVSSSYRVEIPTVKQISA